MYIHNLADCLWVLSKVLIFLGNDDPVVLRHIQVLGGQGLYRNHGGMPSGPCDLEVLFFLRVGQVLL